VTYSDADRATAVRTIGAELGWRDASSPMAGVRAVDAACGPQAAAGSSRTVGQTIKQWVD
jgi:hypothetical protein